MWTTAAPALAASTQEFAICSGVTGTAGFFDGESAEPVTAHEMITLRCITVILPGRGKPPDSSRLFRVFLRLRDTMEPHPTPRRKRSPDRCDGSTTGEVPPGLPRFVHCAKPTEIPFLERIRTVSGAI